MTHRVNDDVQTPIGPGVVQGLTTEGRVLVRVKITDENRHQLQAENCWSPRALLSGMWHFDANGLTPVESRGEAGGTPEGLVHRIEKLEAIIATLNVEDFQTEKQVADAIESALENAQVEVEAYIRT